MENSAALGLGEVEGDSLLAAVVRQEITRHSVFVEKPPPDVTVWVTAPGGLDADHPRAIAGEALGEEGQGGGLLKRENRDIREKRHKPLWANVCASAAAPLP
ncbi:MAG: hypothetical protein HW373_1276 [Deltaproteobacteria bacterium]|nr:hypothetical protein [Deltaproteobacteria bacterium]